MMRLQLLFDHRFYRNERGEICSPMQYDYSLFAGRYGAVFDRVEVIARVSNRPVDFELAPTAEGPGVTVTSLGDWQGAVATVKNLLRIRKDLRNILAAGTTIMAIAPGTLGYLGCRHLKHQGRPYGVEVVGDPFDTFTPRGRHDVIRWAFQRIFAHGMRTQVGHAACTAYVTSKALQRRYPPAADAWSTNYSSIELSPDDIVSCARSARKPDGPIRIILVGSFARMYKGPDVFLLAAAKCIQSGKNIELVLIGDGLYRRQLEALAESLGIHDKVTFTGQLPAGYQIFGQLDRADLFVLPSRTEGLPRAMIEAMARGVPCIGTNVGGIPELLTAENMVPADDSDALARKIAEVVNDPLRMERMSIRNLEIAKRYSSDILQQRRIKLYHQLKDETEAWIAKANA